MIHHILLICVLVYVGYHDAKTMEIENTSVLAVMSISIYSVLKEYITIQYALLNAVITIIVIVFLYICLCSMRMPMIGAGDQKLLIALSSCIGADAVFAVLFFTLVLQMLYISILKLVRKIEINGNMYLPMGPFICTAYVIYVIGELFI